MFQRSLYAFLALTTSILLCYSELHGQNTSIINGVVKNAKGSAISGVHVNVKGSSKGTTTNKDGGFELNVEENEQLQFTHISYRDTTVQLSSAHPAFSGFQLRVVLIPKVYSIRPIEVKRPKPEVVFGHKEMHVADLELIDGGMILLTYTSEKRNKQHFMSKETMYNSPRLVLTDRSQNIMNIKYLFGDAKELHRDHLDRIFLIGRGEVHLVGVDKKNSLVLTKIPRDQFEIEILPCVDTLGNNLYFSSYDASYPAFSYFSFDMEDSSYFELCSVEDVPLMKLFRSQYKYMSGRDKVRAMDAGFNSGVDPEVVAAYMTGFQNDIYYEPLYAPMFVQDETVMVFDHYENVLKKYGPCHEEIEVVELKHHKRKPKRDWRKLLLHDEAKGVVYTVHEKGAKLQLFPIDLETGELGLPFELYYKWAENLHVDNGEVYYIYRPFGSLQKKFLYRETIR